jgi:hypothetical protein
VFRLLEPDILPDVVPDIMTFPQLVLLFPAAAAAAAAAAASVILDVTICQYF